MRPPMPAFARDFARVDDEESRSLLDQSALHVFRQMLPDPFPIERRIQQERSVRREVFEHVVGLEQERLMAGNELRLTNKVGRSDWARAKTQMRDGHRAGFLRIVNEISLRKVFGVFADDFDRLLVRADSSVRAEPEKLCADNVVRFDGKGGVDIETGVTKVVVDPDGEMIFRRSVAPDYRTPP